MDKELIAPTRSVSVEIEYDNAETMDIYIKEESGKVIFEKVFSEMKSYGTYSFEIVLATKAVYYIEAIVNKGTGKERSKNEKIYVYGEIEETKQEEEDTRETVVDALKKAIDQGILGNYYAEEATLGGIAAQVVIGFIPYVGQVADVRDISEDVLNWEWSWEHFSYTVFDSIAIIPGFDCLKGLKHTDELYVIVKRGEKEMLLLIDKVDDVTKKLLKGDKIIGYAAKNGDEIVTAGVKESKKTVGEIVKENADDVVESGSYSDIGVGNSVKIEGRGSIGRTIPNNLEEQMAMHQVGLIYWKVLLNFRLN